ncbi:alginate lyase family protein [Actinacidiphila rubida]|uniref:Alginate lyase n=1 Tax=Actinacidiphila rubida TaxID=310780 RepID=A0A1H8JZ97_9ACTN|nr:alginate lyase family protein [Actinacidiphila rubida]SEN86023.1 Alginate lyase [Actinacidiphila rubida]
MRRGLTALLAACGTLAAVLLSNSPAGAAGVAGRHDGGRPPVRPAPHTVVLDGTRLQRASVALHRGDRALTGVLAQLTAQADGWLTQGPWTVTSKPQTPPGGDRHDYLSQAPYWWPTQPKTADNPWGCPYVQKDGVRNPDVDTITDHDGRGRMFNAVYSLTLAWYYTGRAAYAEHAAQILRTWFTDPATRMNPNLDHGQIIPCRTDGRAIGIIDFSQQFTDVLDATAILDIGAPGWTRADHRGMQDWYTAFTTWLGGSFAAGEADADNNHGTFFDMQLAALQLATGHRDLARQTVLSAETRRIDSQVAGDGGLPQELARTRSFHYSTFDLVALTRLAQIGRHVGVDVWNYRNPAGATVLDAVDFLLPAATGAAAWPYPELEFQRFAASDVVRAAADAGDPRARGAVPLLQAPPGGDLWPLRPATEQLDPISG